MEGFEIGSIVCICEHGSAFEGAMAKVVGYDPKTKKFSVEVQNEDLLFFGVREAERKKRFPASRLKKVFSFEIGDIVTVCLQGSMYDGKQGEVTGIDPETKMFLVRFGPKDKWVCSPCQENSISFEGAQLRKDDGWSPDNMVALLWPSGCNRIKSYKDKFVPGGTCLCEGCEKKAVRRIWINIQGTACEIEVCEDHAKFHGYGFDSFPFRS